MSIVVNTETLGGISANRDAGTYSVADMDQHIAMMNLLFGLHPHTIASAVPSLAVLQAHSEDAFALISSFGGADAANDPAESNVMEDDAEAEPAATNADAEESDVVKEDSDI